ncbi:hypothetical protein ABB37_00812 [Leptomonas pyrrhocoris]|uniref:Uncharacterized protein n=1 Tax=Leptomonas pyrrhocoris TaxID=157538 RepID=A0A0N0E0Q6_LEPPY|nr:hypothetical protein ABB37_00812 [Leptomonas pyrrhocoris]KPA86725.1 hypothetical protein ABB37_00812 [Leptomonas pyrrhocoris]|eukprot:XP_015665164.1 hypothetical protein ABB37_00812 [Leptomonas pyrrhocoris]
MELSVLPDVYDIPRRPPPPALAHNDENASKVYVSKAQRHFCFLIFMYVCWSPASLPLKDVLHALYPLLDPGGPSTATLTGDSAAVAPNGAGTFAENNIAADLFAQPRFANRKRWISGMLSGLVLSRANGLRALLRVLLLDDRVEADITMEAAQLVVRLLTTPPPVVWVLADSPSPLLLSPTNGEVLRQGSVEKGLRVVRDASTSIESEIKQLAPQLLSLLKEQADEVEEGERCNRASAAAKAREGNQPRFLARLEAVHQRLPAETLEQRLHMFVTLLLNALVRLPPRQSAAFARSYRQFFYANKYILSPGFGCLSLRSEGPYREDDVVAALRRLTSLVRGVALGAGTGVLAHVLPATAAGVLNICALQQATTASDAAELISRRQQLDHTMQRFLIPLLSNSSLHELTAHALVQACTTEHSHVFSDGNAVEVELTYVSMTCTARTLTNGLEWLLSAMPVPAPDFVHACVEAMVDACQLHLYASGVESLATPNVVSSSTDNTMHVDSTAQASVSSTPPLVLLLERLCLEAPSEAIFGARERLSLISTLALLGRLLGLSVVLYRWAVGMLNALLRSDSVRVALHGGATSSASVAGVAAAESTSTCDAGQPLEEHLRFLSRLVRTCQGILSTLQALLDHSHSQNSTSDGVMEMAPLIITIEDDPELSTLTSETCAALRSCVTDTMRQLNGCNTTCEVSSTDMESGCHAERVLQHRDSEIAVSTTAQWQRLLTQLQSALDGRSSVDVAMTLASLSRSVDEVVHDVASPEPFQSVVQPLLLTLIRVLYECDEVGCAVRAVHCVTWLCMYRFDSPDSSFIADLVWAVLGEDQLPAWLAAHVGHPAGRAPALVARFCRLRVRLLDVLLAWTDYDEDGRTLRNVDDVLRRTRHIALYDALARLCHNSSDVFVQVAALHLVGAYALAAHPRVPLAALCDLCRDVFHLSPHEMAKAAGAAALGKVVASLCQSSEATAFLLTEVDVDACQSLAAAMASYRGRPPDAAVRGTGTSRATLTEAAAVDLHDAVIQQHGRDMLQLLRRASHAYGAATLPTTPSVLKVKMPKGTFD